MNSDLINAHIAKVCSNPKVYSLISEKISSASVAMGDEIFKEIMYMLGEKKLVTDKDLITFKENVIMKENMRRYILNFLLIFLLLLFFQLVKRT